MRKAALFVEGQTELLFMDRLLDFLAGRQRLVVEHAEATGGATRARRIRIFRRITPRAEDRLYVLLVNCGGDSKVKSDVLERYAGLTAAGFSLILAVRDVYGEFRFEEVERLRAALRQGLPQGPAQVHFCLAIMEIEAWFLAEHTHLVRLDPRLTPAHIRQRTGIDLLEHDLRRRPHPALDLQRVYRLADQNYTKQRHNLQRTLDLLDFERLNAEVARKFEDLGGLIGLLRGLVEEGAAS